MCGSFPTGRPSVKKVTIVPLEVIVRNISAGSFAKRYGVEEGIVFDAPTIEFSYKNDSLGDPLINSYHALALKLATAEELEQIKALAFRVNDLLKGIMKGIGIDLVDFKLEFGRLPDGSIVLADEISPDTCRLWDETTREKLDKDRFRRDLGNVEDAYHGDPAPYAGRVTRRERMFSKNCMRNAAFSAFTAAAGQMLPRLTYQRPVRARSTGDRRAAALPSTTTASYRDIRTSALSARSSLPSACKSSAEASWRWGTSATPQPAGRAAKTPSP